MILHGKYLTIFLNNWSLKATVLNILISIYHFLVLPLPRKLNFEFGGFSVILLSLKFRGFSGQISAAVLSGIGKPQFAIVNEHWRMVVAMFWNMVLTLISVSISMTVWSYAGKISSKQWRSALVICHDSQYHLTLVI